MQKREKLFNKLKAKGVFWSYSKEITLKMAGDELFIEYLLKYGDFEDIKEIFNLYSKEYIKKVWEERLKTDKRFIKLNLMLARLFFGMEVESSYFKGLKSDRFEKLKLLTS